MQKGTSWQTIKIKRAKNQMTSHASLVSHTLDMHVHFLMGPDNINTFLFTKRWDIN